MLELQNIDLSNDQDAALYLKNETVAVEFATESGELMSREGPNRYLPHDAIVTGSTGDRWCVSRERFDAKYEAITPTVFGEAGSYRNKPIPVLARRMNDSFSLARSRGGDVLRGTAGDWVLQYAPGDYGVVEKARFESVYARYREPDISSVWTHAESIETSATPEQVWRLFADVEGWKRWNAGIEHIEIFGDFVAGTTFFMQPPGEEGFTSKLIDVQENNFFVDETVIDSTRVLVNHKLIPIVAGGTRIVYATEIIGPAAAEFGPMVTGDFATVLSALKKLAEDIL
ncbi:MAG TPA: PGDYG domain-containing protein [Spongiibacteraceae bacterium]|nr:PGDYG domain-containing protein [Spongiibacteraceae bacterium]